MFRSIEIEESWFQVHMTQYLQLRRNILSDFLDGEDRFASESQNHVAAYELSHDALGHFNEICSRLPIVRFCQ